MYSFRMSTESKITHSVGMTGSIGFYKPIERKLVSSLNFSVTDYNDRKLYYLNKAWLEEAVKDGSIKYVKIIGKQFELINFTKFLIFEYTDSTSGKWVIDWDLLKDYKTVLVLQGSEGLGYLYDII